MLKQICPAIVMIVLMTVDHRASSIRSGITGIGAGCCSRIRPMAA